MKPKQLLFAIFFLFYLKSFSQTDSVQPKMDPRILEMAVTRYWTTIQFQDCQIQYPSDWVLDTSRKIGTVLFLNTYMENEVDSFSDNFTLITYDNDGANTATDLKKYIEKSIKGIQNLFSGYKQEESAFFFQNGFPAHKHIYLTVSDKGRVIKFEQYTFMRKSTTYVLTLTIENSKFPFYQFAGEYIINSFILASLDF